MRVLIVGCGYVGLPLGAELARRGHEVFGLRRSPGTAGAELEAAGIKPLTADITRPADLARLPLGYDWVVNCVASGGGGADEYRAVYLQGTRNLLDWLAGSPMQKFVYTSSTGVYAQNDGSLVTESSPTEPATETGKILLQTEKVLLEAAQLYRSSRRKEALSLKAMNEDQSLLTSAATDSKPPQNGVPAVVLRLAGIYGPGRGYWLKQFLKGEAKLEGGGERLLNQVHRDDVVGAAITALERATPGSLYNVVDDEPVSQLAMFQWLAKHLNRPLPPSVPEDQAVLRKRGVTNKRVSNAKLKAELAYAFQYPTFREGFAAELGRLGAAGGQA